MKLLVTGAGGLLGSEFVRLGRRSDVDVVPLTRQDVDVTDVQAVFGGFTEESPDWVVHCAAYTAVDQAEEESERAMLINRDGTLNVVRAATAVGARVVYVSSDYVFDGRQREPYKTGDPVAPLSCYAKSKAAGEVAAHDSGQPLIVRTGWLYGAGGRNFVRGILDRAERGLALRVVDDQRGRPTWARNVAETTLELMVGGVKGVWHVADAGDATWLDFAIEALEVSGLTVEIAGVSSVEWGAAAPRPAYSVLDVSATEAQLGRPMMQWKTAVRQYLGEDPSPSPSPSTTTGG